MLVPSEDSSMDSERLASAHRTEGLRSAFPDTASSRLALIDFNVNSVCWSLQNGAASNLVSCRAWRNAHHLHFIPALDATSRSTVLSSFHAETRFQLAGHP